MSNLVPFQQAQVPSYLNNSNMSPEHIKAMAAAAAVGTGGVGLNKISLKQSRFRLVVGGSETVIPSLNIQVAIVRVNDGVSRTWFEKEWNPNEEAGAPECSSDDGIRPRADSPKPQCGPDGLCQNCPQAQWGSKINRLTGEKIKACADSKRMAIVAPGADGRFSGPDADLYQLSVPPASLKEFGGFVRQLAAMPTPAAYNMVVTDVSFDTNVTYPKIKFAPVRWLENDEYAAIAPRLNEAEVQRVAGMAEAQTMRVAPQLAGPAPVQPQAQAQAQAQAQPQQAAAWGQPAQVQQPQAQAQPQQAAAWGQPAQVQPQAHAQDNQQPQPNQATTGRVRGKPSPGKARRTAAEIEEDRLADAADAAGQGHAQQQAQPQQAAAWGQPTQEAPVGWGQPAAQQAPVAVQDNSNPWGQPAAVAQTGAPNQPNVVGSGDVSAALQGWDDAPV